MGKQMDKTDNKIIPVFLDLEDPNNISGGSLEGLPESTKKAFQKISTDEKVAEVLIGRFIANRQQIGKRIKEMGNLGISYSTKSVKLYHQAKDLYSLGYFESAIVVCRATAEYLAYEIFVERINIDGEREIIERLAESLDFRKIVNNFLCPSKNGNQYINQQSKKLFNNLYDLGNKWIHPKQSEQTGLNVEHEAKNAIETLKELIDSLRNVFNDYQIEKGSLKIKTASIGKYKRGIKLEGS